MPSIKAICLKCSAYSKHIIAAVAGRRQRFSGLSRPGCPCLPVYKCYRLFTSANRNVYGCNTPAHPDRQKTPMHVGRQAAAAEPRIAWPLATTAQRGGVRRMAGGREFSSGCLSIRQYKGGFLTGGGRGASFLAACAFLFCLPISLLFCGFFYGIKMNKVVVLKLQEGSTKIVLPSLLHSLFALPFPVASLHCRLSLTHYYTYKQKLCQTFFCDEILTNFN